MPYIIPKSSLEKWARKKFHEQCSTVDLMASVEDLGDKVAIAIVSLLEVRPEIRYSGMGAEELQYVKSCHAYLNWLLEHWEAK